jgi:DNA-nicking Smr family endonuclease
MTRRGAQGSGSPRKGGLSAEDEALWELASQTYEPLKRSKPRVHGHERAEQETKPHRPALQNSHLPPRDGLPHAPARALPPPAAPSPVKAPPLAEFDRRKARKIADGREAIDGRIDLHGMRQSEAHAALRSFLLSNYANGRRNLLVITGKGGAPRDDSEPAGFMDTRERGVLKRNVPMWLAEPELRAIVVSYREAAQLHGGAGALYVHLRARRKVGKRD